MPDKPSPDEQIVNRLHEAPNLPSLSRYDWAMLNIPLGYFVALLASTVLSTTLFTTMSVASVLGMLVIADVLFWHPPSTTDTDQTTE